MTFLHAEAPLRLKVDGFGKSLRLRPLRREGALESFAVEGQALEAVRFMPAGAVREAGGRLTAIPDAADAYAKALDDSRPSDAAAGHGAARGLTVEAVVRAASGCFWLQPPGGQTLETWLADHPGPVAEPVVAAFARGLARALEELHAAGVDPRRPVAPHRADRQWRGPPDGVHGRPSSVLPGAARPTGPGRARVRAAGSPRRRPSPSHRRGLGSLCRQRPAPAPADRPRAAGRQSRRPRGRRQRLARRRDRVRGLARRDRGRAWRRPRRLARPVRRPGWPAWSSAPSPMAVPGSKGARTPPALPPPEPEPEPEPSRSQSQRAGAGGRPVLPLPPMAAPALVEPAFGAQRRR
jgi:hypothetical protein